LTVNERQTFTSLFRGMSHSINPSSGTRTIRSNLPPGVEPLPLLAAIVESSDDAIISKDLTGIITSWNQSAERIFGYKPNEIIGKSVLTLIPEDLHSQETDILTKLRAGERIEHFETRRLRKDGSCVDVSLTISPIRDDQGHVIGASKIAREIGEKKLADEARLKLAAIVESSDDAIIGKDLNGVITSWNRGAERTFGYKSEEIVGRSVLTLIPPELHSEEPEILRNLRAGNRIEHYETRRVTKSGDIIDVSLTISPIKDSSGKTIGVSKIARNISDIKRAQQALIQSEKLAATGRMAATIAHEINNPLEAVTNLAYLLVTDTSLNDRARNYAQMLLNEVSRASDITRQTLAFYRDTTGPRDVDICDLLDNVIDLQKRKIAAHEIRVIRDFDRKVVVWGYGAELRQVFLNLILNAIDALDAGGVIKVRVKLCGAKKDVASISVADSGSGIPPQAVERIFEPFFTTKASKGNGLGLWISKGIVDKHAGQIRVRSKIGEHGHGTVFNVTLPRRLQSAQLRKVI
jgi:PAS domain S-box-containing protein